LAKLQAQLLDTLGTIQSQEGSLETRASPDNSQQREIFGKASWSPKEIHTDGVRGKEIYNPFLPGV
jgi:hypothetical protein